MGCCCTFVALQYTRYENATVENELKISKPHTHTEVFTPSKSTQTLIFHLRAIKPTGKILKNITRAFQLVSVSLSDMKHHNNCPVTQNPIFYCAQRKYRIHKDNTHMLHLREQSGKRTHSKAVREILFEILWCRQSLRGIWYSSDTISLDKHGQIWLRQLAAPGSGVHSRRQTLDKKIKVTLLNWLFEWKHQAITNGNMSFVHLSFTRWCLFFFRIGIIILYNNAWWDTLVEISNLWIMNHLSLIVL